MHTIPPAASPKLGSEPVDAAPAPGQARRRAATKPKTVSKRLAKAATTSNHKNSKRTTAKKPKMSNRERHNTSARRSRVRFNGVLDKMWKTISPARRRKHFEEDTDGQDAMEDIDDEEEKRTGQADKVEICIAYIHCLEKRVKELEAQINCRH